VGGAAALLTLVIAYYESSTHLWRASTWWDVAWLGFVLLPAVFGLVLCALPLWRARGLLLVGAAFIVLAVAFGIADWQVWANFARLAAAVLIGWWFLAMFEELSWVVLVACVIPWVDAYSVWRGPTKQIVTHHQHVFGYLSFAFPVPGEHSAANLGVPDVFFFAFFLAASARFGLRIVPTYAGLVAGLGLTIAATVLFNLDGLPALPGIAVGFLAPNADLLYRRLRPRESAPGRPGRDSRSGA
jgi:hypothetical protein